MDNKTAVDWKERFHENQQRAITPLLKQYYLESELPELTTPIKGCEFLAMDFETTGLNSKKDSIISIGVVPFNLQRIYLNQAKQWKVKPRSKLSTESVVIHGSPIVDLSDAPDLSAIIPELLESMKGKIIVAHYHPIERQF